MGAMVTKIKVVLSISLRCQWDIGSAIAREKCPSIINNESRTTAHGDLEERRN